MAAGTAVGLAVAAMSGSFGARPAVAASAAAAAPTPSIEGTAQTIRICRAPDPAADALPEGEPALTFGFLVFEWDTADGSPMHGFAPMPTPCTLSKSLDG
jgi:hypothetical protein